MGCMMAYTPNTEITPLKGACATTRDPHPRAKRGAESLLELPEVELGALLVCPFPFQSIELGMGVGRAPQSHLELRGYWRKRARGRDSSRGELQSPAGEEG